MVGDLAAFHKGKAVGEVPRRLEAEEEGLIAGRVALYPSSLECPAFMRSGISSLSFSPNRDGRSSPLPPREPFLSRLKEKGRLSRLPARQLEKSNF